METTETAIRMVGQLLLHHPTTGAMFERTSGELVTPWPVNKETMPKDVCGFCYVGAIRATALALDRDQYALWEACDKAIRDGGGERLSLEGDDWDNMSCRSRNHIARKLANYKETP